MNKMMNLNKIGIQMRKILKNKKDYLIRCLNLRKLIYLVIVIHKKSIKNVVIGESLSLKIIMKKIKIFDNFYIIFLILNIIVRIYYIKMIILI